MLGGKGTRDLFHRRCGQLGRKATWHRFRARRQTSRTARRLEVLRSLYTTGAASGWHDLCRTSHALRVRPKTSDRQFGRRELPLLRWRWWYLGRLRVRNFTVADWRCGRRCRSSLGRIRFSYVRRGCTCRAIDEARSRRRGATTAGMSERWTEQLVESTRCRSARHGRSWAC